MEDDDDSFENSGQAFEADLDAILDIPEEITEVESKEE
jgi:hypothetical protein